MKKGLDIIGTILHRHQGNHSSYPTDGAHTEGLAGQRALLDLGTRIGKSPSVALCAHSPSRLPVVSVANTPDWAASRSSRQRWTSIGWLNIPAKPRKSPVDAFQRVARPAQVSPTTTVPESGENCAWERKTSQGAHAWGIKGFPWTRGPSAAGIISKPARVRCLVLRATQPAGWWRQQLPVG
jgi:hypothetical protein